MATAALPAHYVSVAAVTHPGLVREKNEDAFVVADLTRGLRLVDDAHARFEVGERGVLLAVSDGMGGAWAGDVASALVVDTVTREIADAPPVTPRDAVLSAAVHAAHEAVRKRGERDHATMGATLTAVLVRGGRAYVAEVGDSRAYLVRGAEIAQLTHDQSLAQLLVDSGVLDPRDARHSPLRSVILQAMGHQPDLAVALGRFELRDRDRLVLCSDGLTTHVTDEEIRDIVLSSRRPDNAAHALVALANARGGTDNITVVVADLGGALAPPAPGERPEGAVEVISTYEPKVG